MSIKDVQVVDVEGRAARDRFDCVFRRYLDMSGRDFVRYYQAGKFDGVDVDEMPGLSKVLSVLPFAGL